MNLEHGQDVSAGRRSRHDEERDADLYFDDGNIVLQVAPSVNQEQVTVYFRVHRSLLWKHCNVFKDMLSIPAPMDGAFEKYDSTPLVVLQDDPSDVKAFLQLIYEVNLMSIEWFNSNTALQLLGPLRVAIKYEADHIRTQIISIIRRDWPTNLSNWNQRWNILNWRKFTNQGGRCAPEPAIRLAREFQLDDILPLMYFECIRNSYSSADFTRLIEEDLCIIWRGKEKIQTFLSVNWLCKRMCKIGGQLNAVYRCETHLRDLFKTIILNNDPLAKILEEISNLNKQDQGSLCAICCPIIVKQLGELRDNFFIELPQFMGFEEQYTLKS